MKNYKLINRTTKEETICTKVNSDGFDYYVSNDVRQIKVSETYLGFDSTEQEYILLGNSNDSWRKHYPDKTDEEYENYLSSRLGKDDRKIIATTNPNIDIPKVIDEDNIINIIIDEILGFKTVHIQETEFITGLKLGYNKHKETNSNSDEDMSAFAEWCKKPSLEDSRQPNVVYIHFGNFYWHKHKKYAPKELLELWKEQRVETIYYE